MSIQSLVRPFRVAKNRPPMSKRAKREAAEGFLFISPWILGFLFFTIGPIIASFYFSFTDYNIMESHWVGLANYTKIFTDDPKFWVSLYNTAYFTFLAVPMQLVIALCVAMLINQKIRGISVFRTMFYLPSMTPAVASAVLWLWLLDFNFGLINGGLALFHIPPIPWLGTPEWAKPALILMSLWGIGGSMIIFLAGLQGIPQEYYDAAYVDGANRWQIMLNVTIPLLSPVIFFNFIIGIIGSFQVFSQAYIMTGGGPVQATLFYVLYIFQEAFQGFRMGYASALSWILMIIVLLLTLFNTRVVGSRVYYEEE